VIFRLMYKFSLAAGPTEPMSIALRLRLRPLSHELFLRRQILPLAVAKPLFKSYNIAKNINTKATMDKMNSPPPSTMENEVSYL